MLTALWFIPFTVINMLTWRLVPCEWHRPYQDVRRAERA